ncbi:MAG: glycosyltransferase family 2 protein [Bacteroidales bacterium]|nr:glycosyltransferase family 2 protein [Bacteroidales bacterium]
MDIRIVIPCYNEPHVLLTLKSLSDCERNNFQVEIIIVVNSYSISSVEIKEFNRETYARLNDYALQNNTSGFILHPLLYEDLPGHQTGAGLPRKIGMDLAVKNFYEEGNNQGIIVSLDADCTVDPNYLSTIYSSFRKLHLKSATLEFHHAVEHLAENDKIRQATEVYEEYLRYYRAALEYTGYPYAYYTIGSAFAVTAETYRQAGGMGKQQAGEDFYFLQKVFPLGKTLFIDSTKVYPAARTSDRVPFGTGPAIEAMIRKNDIRKLSYQVRAFEEIKVLFDSIDSYFKKENPEILKKSRALPKHLFLFLQEDNFFEKLKEINLHTATISSFRKRFFNYFNAFKILKYLNYVHPSPYMLTDVREQYRQLRLIQNAN